MFRLVKNHHKKLECASIRLRNAKEIRSEREGNYNELDIDTNQLFTFRNESAAWNLEIEIKNVLISWRKTCYHKIRCKTWWTINRGKINNQFGSTTVNNFSQTKRKNWFLSRSDLWTLSETRTQCAFLIISLPMRFHFFN